MSANDDLVDMAIMHQVELARYSNNVVRRIMAILNRSDARLTAELTSVVSQLNDGTSTFRMDRLESLLSSLRAVNAQAYAQVDQALREELLNFTQYEASWQQMSLGSVLPAQVSVASVAVDQIYAAAMSRPFQGTLLKDALTEVSAFTAKKIRETIAQGIVEGRTTDQIVRDIRGTKASNYTDGLLERSRKDVEAIVRTAVSHVANTTQTNVMAANSDLIRAVQWSATLDLRTTSQCRLRDGLLYETVSHRPIGHSIPWRGGPGSLHWNCRSAQVPVLKTWKEMGLDLAGGPELAGTRASLDGQVSKDLDYASWLKRQSAERQDEVLGPKRGKLLRAGGLDLKDMYDQRGRFLTLEELRARSAAAFQRAGV